MVALFHYLESFIGNSAYQQFNSSKAEKQVDTQARFEFLWCEPVLIWWKHTNHLDLQLKLKQTS